MEKTAIQKLIDGVQTRITQLEDSIQSDNPDWRVNQDRQIKIETLQLEMFNMTLALEEEKQQMIEIFKDGFYKGCDQPLMDKVVEEYFNEKFGGKIKP